MLLEVKEQTGVVARELLTAPTVPPTVAHIWRWFCDLSRGRAVGMSLNAIAWSDMQAYFQLMRVQPLRWEIQALRRTDDAFIESRLGDPTVELSSAQGFMRQIEQ